MTLAKDKKPQEHNGFETGHKMSQNDPEMLLLNEDGTEFPQSKDKNPTRRMALPVGVWAKLQQIKLRNPVRVGEEAEKNFFMEKDYDIIILTNRTIRIKLKSPRQGHVYTPLENVIYYQVTKDAAFEKRFQEASDTGPSGVETQENAA